MFGWLHCRTACRYGGKNIAFHVNEGSTGFWLSLLVEFEDGDGDIGSMQLKQVTTHHPDLFFHTYASHNFLNTILASNRAKPSCHVAR